MLGTFSLFILIAVMIFFSSSIFVIIIVLAIIFLSSLPLLLTLLISSKTLTSCLVSICLLFWIRVCPSRCIILRLRVSVRKDIICLCDLFELSFVLWFAVSRIWMILFSKFIKLLFNLLLIRCFVESKPPIVVCLWVERYSCGKTSHLAANMN